MEAFGINTVIKWICEHVIGPSNQVSVHKENNPASYLTFIIGFWKKFKIEGRET